VCAELLARYNSGVATISARRIARELGESWVPRVALALKLERGAVLTDARGRRWVLVQRWRGRLRWAREEVAPLLQE